MCGSVVGWCVCVAWWGGGRVVVCWVGWGYLFYVTTDFIFVFINRTIYVVMKMFRIHVKEKQLYFISKIDLYCLESIKKKILIFVFVYTSFTYTDFSYESLRIAQIHGFYHGSLRFGHFYDRFKCCYGLVRAIYGLLRIITNYYEILTA